MDAIINERVLDIVLPRRPRAKAGFLRVVTSPNSFRPTGVRPGGILGSSMLLAAAPSTGGSISCAAVIGSTLAGASELRLSLRPEAAALRRLLLRVILGVATALCPLADLIERCRPGRGASSAETAFCLDHFLALWEIRRVALRGFEPVARRQVELLRGPSVRRLEWSYAHHSSSRPPATTS